VGGDNIDVRDDGHVTGAYQATTAAAPLWQRSAPVQIVKGGLAGVSYLPPTEELLAGGGASGLVSDEMAAGHETLLRFFSAAAPAAAPTDPATLGLLWQDGCAGEDCEEADRDDGGGGGGVGSTPRSRPFARETSSLHSGPLYAGAAASSPAARSSLPRPSPRRAQYLRTRRMSSGLSRGTRTPAAPREPGVRMQAEAGLSGRIRAAQQMRDEFDAAAGTSGERGVVAASPSVTAVSALSLRGMVRACVCLGGRVFGCVCVLVVSSLHPLHGGRSVVGGAGKHSPRSRSRMCLSRHRVLV
jgi:hypothetical protein